MIKDLSLPRLTPSRMTLLTLFALSACQNSQLAQTPAGALGVSYVREVPDLAPGGLSVQEWEALALEYNQQGFAGMDADHNTSVSLQEYNAGLTASGQSALATFKDSPYPTIDTDADGSWQAREYTIFARDYVKLKGSYDTFAFLLTAYVLKHSNNTSWTTLDKDKNSSLSLDELLPSFPAAKGTPCPSSADCKDADLLASARKAFEKMDLDRDQKLSYGEFQRDALATYKRQAELDKARPKASPAAG